MYNLVHTIQKNEPFWQSLDKDARVAHIIIDVQKEYCRYEAPKGLWQMLKSLKENSWCASEQTQRAAEHIATITPEFRALCDKTFVVYMDPENEGIEQAYGGIDFITVEDGDIPIKKTDNNAFSACVPENSFEQKLHEAGITHLLLSGGKINACLKDTAITAIAKGFNVAVMSDCLYAGSVDDDFFYEHLENIENNGVSTTLSDTARYKLVQRAIEQEEQLPIAIPTPAVAAARHAAARHRLAQAGLQYGAA